MPSTHLKSHLYTIQQRQTASTEAAVQRDDLTLMVAAYKPTHLSGQYYFSN